jgi:hypothetical protein
MIKRSKNVMPKKSLILIDRTIPRKNLVPGQTTFPPLALKPTLILNNFLLMFRFHLFLQINKLQIYFILLRRSLLS